MEKHQTKSGYILFLGLALLIFLLSVAMINRSRNEKNITTPPQQMQETNTMVIKPKKGSLVFQTSQASAGINSNITETIVADSNGKDIIGFDIVLQFDPAKLQIIDTQSLRSDFIIYTFKRVDGITITGTKAVNNTSATIFTKTPLIRLTLQAKIAGTHSLAIKDKLDKEVTKFVDVSTNILSPKVQEKNIQVSSRVIRTEPAITTQ